MLSEGSCEASLTKRVKNCTEHDVFSIINTWQEFQSELQQKRNCAVHMKVQMRLEEISIMLSISDIKNKLQNLTKEYR